MKSTRIPCPECAAEREQRGDPTLPIFCSSPQCGHTQDCLDSAFEFHTATGGDAECLLSCRANREDAAA